jgi:hypothetical protein
MSDAALEAQLKAVRVVLDRGPQPDDIENVVPVIVPRTFFAAGNWPGPHAHLRRETLGLTWAVLARDQTMVFVNEERDARWSSEGVDWRGRAIANLVERSRTNLWTHERTDAKGDIVFVAMMQPDGLGSSRALLRRALELNIKTKYRIGLPDRSCCILFPISATTIGHLTPAQMVANMYDGATTPLCRDLLEPDELEVVANAGQRASRSGP